jgi:predicted nucleic acid-binding protein
MLVVSDTSPLRALQAIGHLQILESLYRSGYVPPAVAAELQVAAPREQPLDVASLPFVVVRAPLQMAVFPATPRLGLGEQQAIALALEIGASTLLIDDSDARRAASRCGVSTTGVLGVLVEAKRRGVVSEVAPLMDLLRERIAFRISDLVAQDVLRQAGEL